MVFNLVHEYLFHPIQQIVSIDCANETQKLHKNNSSYIRDKNYD